MKSTFQAYLAEQNYAAVRTIGVLGMLLMPAGVLLDVLTRPEKARDFLLLRLLAAGLSLLVLAATRLQVARRHLYLLGALVIVGCSAAIQVMILRLEGATSPYYAGLNLCVLGAGLAFVWSARQSAVVCLIVLGMWLLPALWMRQYTSRDFYNNLYFLTLTGVIAVAANATRYNLARREYDARMALAQASADLQTSLERIRELDRLKSQFFANVSHELRTPLTLITAPIQEILHRGELMPPVSTTLQVILRNALRLHRLIDGLLDLARLEAGRLRLRISPLDMPQLVQGVVASFRPAADAMSLDLRLEIAPSPVAGAAVMGDADKLEVVLTNLLGNAVKFTDKGGRITVRLSWVGGADSVTGPGIELQVEDNGLGIPPEDQPHIFERFRRVESPGRKQGGAGIGLALVKELVELHGGQVAVRSAPGEGACFTVRLPTGGAHLSGAAFEDATPQGAVPLSSLRARPREPLSPSSPALLHVNDSLDSKRQIVYNPAEPPAVAEQAGRAHLLVAEDNVDLRRFLCDLLSSHYHIEAVADGRAALDAMHRRAPDLLLADVMMPHLSGIDVCQQVKADPRLQGTPVILLTARGGVEETLEGFAHGADDYIVKPFNPRELLVRVQVQLRLRQLSAQVANAARLAAVGTLAAGVAHEIKNPLNAIGTGVMALRRRGAAALAGGEVLDMMEECVGRIAGITTVLMDHARPADGEGLSWCDLGTGMDSTLRLLEDALRSKGLEVVRAYRTSRQILGRPRQLNQVFLNLLDNAVRASQPGGKIYVTLEERGDRLVVRVRDEGCGMSREVQQRIFDAFFTTRPAGEGTGLGLYLSQKIVAAHDGTLWVTSEEGRGTEFSVDIPQQPKTAEPERAAQPLRGAA